jgi:hypothetical protein
MKGANILIIDQNVSIGHNFYVSIQNYTQDNRTQGIMEKSQWDLKKVRLQGRRFKRMDDFVAMHKVSTNALLREYADSLKERRKQKVICYFYLKTYAYTQSLTHSRSLTN